MPWKAEAAFSKNVGNGLDQSVNQSIRGSASPSRDERDPISRLRWKVEPHCNANHAQQSARWWKMIPAREKMDRDRLFVLALSGAASFSEQSAKWWRRGELNPCPRSFMRKLLHAYPMVSFKRPNVAPAHCRPPSVHEIPSPPDAVTPADD